MHRRLITFRARAGVALIAARAPNALETIDAIVRRRNVSVEAPVESPSEHSAFWERQREVSVSDAVWHGVGGAAFGMSSAMAPWGPTPPTRSMALPAKQSHG